MRYFTALTLLVFLGLWWLSPDTATTAVTTGSNVHPTWSEAAILSDAPQGAERPYIAAGAGERLLLVYTQIDGGAAAYPTYRLSNNFGTTWTAPAPIYNASGDSRQVHAVLDQNNNGHAVWREGPFEIRYAAQSDWGGAVSTLLFSSDVGVPSFPKLVASGSGQLDAVWAGLRLPEDNNSNIFHTFSTNNGATWQTASVVASTLPSSLFPSLAVGPDGTRHVVWAEETALGNERIMYAQGTVAGSTITWSEAIIVSNPNLPYTTSPTVVMHNNAVQVFYTWRDDQGNNEVYQYIYLAICATNCANPDNWVSASGNPVSGTLVGANTNDPFYVESTAVVNQGCLYSYFHGTNPTDPNVNQNSEIVWGINSCGLGWDDGRDQTTEYNSRSLYPALATHDDWLFLVYESAPLGAGYRQVHFRRAQVDIVPLSRLYLPIIRR